MWDQVQVVLAKDNRERAASSRRTDALLRGLLYSPSGEKMYPTYTSKKGKQYRYYHSRSEKRFGASAKTHDRISADQVEAAAIAQIQTVLASPEAITAVCRQLNAKVDEALVVLSLNRLGAVWGQLFPAEQQRLVQLMIERVDLVEEGLRITWLAVGWKALLQEFAPGSIGAETLEGEGTS